jgi:hypothetical protein
VIGVAVLLTALLSAAGAASGLTKLSEQDAEANADTISIVGGVLLVLVLAILGGFSLLSGRTFGRVVGLVAATSM